MGAACRLLLLLLLASTCWAAVVTPRPLLGAPGPHTARAAPARLDARSSRLMADRGCSQHWFGQPLDHYSFGNRTYQQRYFTCDRHWARRADGGRGPIWFYAGNEGPVDQYIKASGLMFENAQEFGALLLFAEHRYYGESQPFGPDSWSVDPAFLTSGQALADYAALLSNLTRAWGAADSPVIAFGGSYGGLLAAWMRRLYPHLVQGAVASSAPVGAVAGAQGGFDPAKFWQVVTRDATAAGGSPPLCAAAVRSAYGLLLGMGHTPQGRSSLQRAFRLCSPIKDETDVMRLAFWIQGAWDAFAMGNYPYPSDYIAGDPDHPMPAWPVRAACRAMMDVAPSCAARSLAAAAKRLEAAGAGKHPSSPSSKASSSSPSSSSAAAAAAAAAAAGRPGAARDGLPGCGDAGAVQLLEGLREAVGVLYNVTRDQRCYSLEITGPAAASVGPWDFQFCTEGMAQEVPYFPGNGVTDMFWDQGPFDERMIDQHCRAAWGVAPRPGWLVQQYGGYDYRGVSNVVFPNGLLDPWSAYGYYSRSSPGVTPLVIPNGAHHVDLMFSHPDDTPDIRAARVAIMKEVARWTQAACPACAAPRPRQGAPV